MREIDRFIEGIEKDKEAVKNAILYRYSNGLIEGIINKLKTIKKTDVWKSKFDIIEK
ncbi:transposase [Caldicellulosiruptoraceae bacterium PP1]